MRSALTIICFFAACSGFFQVAQSQQFSSLSFKHLTVENGLSQNVAWNIFRDSKGFVWMGTQDGLNRFDGYTCKQYRNKTNDSTSLAGSSIRGIEEDSNGNLWIGTNLGISCYNRKSDAFVNYHIGVNTTYYYHVLWVEGESTIGFRIDGGDPGLLFRFNILSNKIDSIPLSKMLGEKTHACGVYSTDRNTLIILGQTDGQLWKLHYDTRLNQFIHQPEPLLNLKCSRFYPVNTIMEDSKIYVVDSSQLHVINMDGKTYRTVNLSRPVYSGDILKYNQSVLISDLNAGIFVFDPVTGRLVDSIRHNEKDARTIAADYIQDMLIDTDGNLWVSCFGKGVSYSNLKQKIFNLFRFRQEDNFIRALLPSKNNRLWCGTIYSGLFLLDSVKRVIMHIPFFQNRINKGSEVAGLVEDGAGRLFAGTDVGLFVLENKMTPREVQIPGSLSIFSIFLLKDGVLLASSNLGFFEFKKINQEWILQPYNAIPNVSQVYYGYENNQGVLLLAVNKTIQLWRRTAGGFKKIKTIPLVYDVKAVHDNVNTEKMWLATIGGLFWINKQTWEMGQPEIQHSFPNHYLYGILEDKNGFLWISSNAGLIKYHPAKNTFVNYTSIHGLQGNEFNTNAFGQLSNGEFVFGGINGINYFGPEQIRTNDDGHRTKLHITDFNNQDTSFHLPIFISETEGIKLRHFQNSFEITYSAVNFSIPPGFQIRYRLAGLEDNWIIGNYHQTIRYAEIPPGNYSFELEELNESGIKTGVYKSLPIYISTPFWRTWWFSSLCAAALITVLYLAYRYRINQLKKLMRVRARISQDLHDEVGAALSSIHVYSSVATKAMGKDAEKAREALTHINQNTRQVMENMSDIVWAINTGDVGETALEAKLKNYGYELLSPLNIRCTYWIDKETDKKLVNIEARKNILLIVKEAMNNIAKYSIATEAVVKLEFHHKFLHLEIGDNGKGVDQVNNRQGNGLHNMRQRAEVLGGTFLFNSEKDKGTVVQCKIPLTNIRD